MQICFLIQNFLFLHDLFSLSLFLALSLSRFITRASLISFRWKACSALQNMQKYLYVGQCQPTTYSFWGQVDEALFVISLICNIFFTTYIIHTQKACPQIVIEYIGTKRIQPSINIPIQYQYTQHKYKLRGIPTQYIPSAISNNKIIPLKVVSYIFPS